MTAYFHIITLGCKVNRVEADNIAAKLLAAGAERSDLQDANLVFINTCTVTGEADSKSRKAQRRALREAPGAHIIVCGCGAVTNPDQFENNAERIHIISDTAEAISKAEDLLGLSQKEETQLRMGESFNTRVAIKVQDGCDNRCSYCIVPFARGPAKSVPMTHILEEAKAYAEAGAQEMVLTGIDLGSYRHEGALLDTLLEELLKVNATCRYRLSSIELPSISDDLLQVIAKSDGRVCAHLHIPLQSGSDTILASMKRRYDVAEFMDRIKTIKGVLPRVALTTDVIVGYPGETDEDFDETLAVCREVGFSRIHIFRYSKREGTVAAELPGAVDATVMASRAQTLQVLSEELTHADAQSRMGSLEKVLFESDERGRTESYYPVCALERSTRGNLVTMKLSSYQQGEFRAQEYTQQ